MPHDFRILFYAVLASAAVIVLVFSFPSLTTRDDTNLSDPTSVGLDAAFAQELSFCASQPEDINCQCFASVSSRILSDNEPRVPGARYADKQDLARGQATNSC